METAPKALETLSGKLALVTFSVLIVGGFIQFFLCVEAWQSANALELQLRNRGLAATLVRRLEPVLADSWLRMKAVLAASVENRNYDLYVLDEAGGILADLSRTQNPVHGAIPLEPIRRYLDAGGRLAAPIYNRDLHDPDRVAVFSVAPLRIGDRSGYLYLSLGGEAERTFSNLLAEATTMRGAFGATVLSVSALALVAALILRLVTKRFERMTEIVREYGSGSFERRVRSDRHDELDVHAQTINAMADGIMTNLDLLRRKDQRRRDLLAAVVQDLSAPMRSIDEGLAEIRAGKGTGAMSEPEIRRIFDESAVLGRSLVNLFELARIEAGDLRPGAETFSLREVLEDAAMIASSRGDAQRPIVDLELDSRLPALFVGDVEWTIRIVNAALEWCAARSRYGGRLRLTVTPAHQSASLRIHFSPNAVQKEPGEPRGSIVLGTTLEKAIVRAMLEAMGSAFELEQLEREEILRFELPFSTVRYLRDAA